jgi:hypothetical protein
VSLPPTWQELQTYHCSRKWLSATSHPAVPNPYYEDAATRRYNYARSLDRSECRLVFLQGVLDDPRNKTLVRGGRFIWCKNLRYEGPGTEGLRQISFTVDNGQKRFLVSENHMLCLPSKLYINNNRFFRRKEKTFTGFSSVFAYPQAITMMCNHYDGTKEDLINQVRNDSPYRPGTLVAPKLGYFYPMGTASETPHPYGIILGHSVDNSSYGGREFYRVRFANTTYERVHPVEMEIINEV